MARPPFTVEGILAWADAWWARTGLWPHSTSGPIPESPGDTWKTVDKALRQGLRCLRGGSSLARLLAERRGYRNMRALPPLTEDLILAWADAHRAATGRWPDLHSGAIAAAPGESWWTVNHALTRGLRGLAGGGSLARLLAERRGASRGDLPRLTEAGILAWADHHKERTGSWPNAGSGAVRGAGDETWRNIDKALRYGFRGLPGGSSLSVLLERRRGARGKARTPARTPEQILAWARLHRGRTGRWPSARSGVVLDAPGETWKALNAALAEGYRGLPGGSSLAELLRGVKG